MLEQLKEALDQDSRYKHVGLKITGQKIKDDVYINKTSGSEVRFRHSELDTIAKAILMDKFGELYIELKDQDILRILKGRIVLKSTDVVIYF